MARSARPETPLRISRTIRLHAAWISLDPQRAGIGTRVGPGIAADARSFLPRALRRDAAPAGRSARPSAGGKGPSYAAGRHFGARGLALGPAAGARAGRSAAWFAHRRSRSLARPAAMGG